MLIEDSIANATGLYEDEADLVRELVRVWRARRPKNMLRESYYLEHVNAKGLGIAVPPKLKIKACCGWPRKAVDYIASRSIFDGYTTSNEDAAEKLRLIVAENDMKNSYAMGATSELVHCFTMLTVTKGEGDGRHAIVSMTPATLSSGLYDDHERKVSAGLAVTGLERKNGRVQPNAIDVFLADSVVSLVRGTSGWEVLERMDSTMGRVLMEPMANAPTLMRPFGRSLITNSVMLLADNYMREAVRSETAAEFAASPQKFLLGANKKTVSGMSKYDAYIGSVFAISKDRDGDVPQFGQLPQPSMQPHIEYNRSLACQFSGETNVPLSALGVVSDNPSSADAIHATKEDAIIQVQRINAVNGRALVNAGWMALAIVNGTDFKTEQAACPDLQARFTNPDTPSASACADAMLKQVQAIPWIGESEVALEQLGYNDEQIQRLRYDKRRNEGRALASAIVGERQKADEA